MAGKSNEDKMGTKSIVLSSNRIFAYRELVTKKMNKVRHICGEKPRRHRIFIRKQIKRFPRNYVIYENCLENVFLYFTNKKTNIERLFLKRFVGKKKVVNLLTNNRRKFR